MKVYTASKLHHRRLWKQISMQPEWEGIEFHARWFGQVDRGTPDDAENAKVFWMENIEDIDNCDALLLYAVPADQLRGAIFEAGYALAIGKPVILIGNNQFYGTWQHIPVIYHASGFEGALLILRDIERQMEGPSS